MAVRRFRDGSRLVTGCLHPHYELVTRRRLEGSRVHAVSLTPHLGREVLDVGPLRIVPDEHLARADGSALTLSMRELRILTEMARRSDRIMAREELFRLVWGREMRHGDRSVDVYVRKLRIRLEAALPGWNFIHTHFGLGYRLAAEHRPQGDTPSQLGNTSA